MAQNLNHNNTLPLIELRDLTKIYREDVTENIVLNEANLTVYHGELIILLGRHSSGVNS